MLLFAAIFIKLAFTGRSGDEVSHLTSELKLRACSILQSNLLEVIGEGQEVKTAIALSDEPYGYSYELQFDAMVESGTSFSVTPKTNGLGDNGKVQARRARYLTALMLMLDAEDMERLGKGLQILLPKEYKDISKIDCSSPWRSWDLLELIVRYEEDPLILRCLLVGLRAWKHCPYHTLGGWEVVVRALSRVPGDEFLLPAGVLRFLAFRAKPPTDKEVTKATLEVLAKIIQENRLLVGEIAVVTRTLSTQEGCLPLIRDSGLAQVLAGSLNIYGEEFCTANELIFDMLKAIALSAEEEIKGHLRIEICPHIQAFVERHECYASGELNKSLVDTIARIFACHG